VLAASVPSLLLPDSIPFPPASRRVARVSPLRLRPNSGRSPARDGLRRRALQRAGSLRVDRRRGRLPLRQGRRRALGLCLSLHACQREHRGPPPQRTRPTGRRRAIVAASREVRDSRRLDSVVGRVRLLPPACSGRPADVPRELVIFCGLSWGGLIGYHAHLHLSGARFASSVDASLFWCVATQNCWIGGNSVFGGCCWTSMLWLFVVTC
jgi:hypothetical protein